MVAAVGKGMRWCMPAVVENQQQKFEMDPEIRQLIGPTQIAYAGCLHAPIAERRNTFMQNCSEREQRHIPITFTQYGYNSDFKLSACSIGQHEVTFESRFILNGVCVLLRGNLNRETLVGSSTLQFDAETAAIEDIRRREILAQHGDRIRNIQRRFNLQS
uniref:Protein big brother n=1 Tax=Ascaris suum TaxID=6253 RepID=F1LBN2_ASCSU